MNTAVLIPHGGICPYRARALAWVVQHYQRHHPWPIHIGTSDEPWSKGAAVADALIQTDADMLVIADADSFVTPEHVTTAVQAAAEHGWAMPHWKVYRLSERATEQVYAGGPPSRTDLYRGAYAGVMGGGIVAIRRDVYELVGGIDPRFCGWGGEDVSLARALIVMHGKPARMAGDLFHLYHPHPAPNLRGSEASEVLVARYKAAVTRPQMQALIDERRAT